MNKDIYINMLVVITAILVMAMGIGLAAGAEPATVDISAQTPCHFVDSVISAASYHSTALIASRELFPQGITPEEQSCSNQPKGRLT